MKTPVSLIAKLFTCIKGNLLAFLVMIGLPALLQAQDSIGFHFASPKNTDQNVLLPGDFAGAPGVRTNNWNNFLASVDGSGASLTNTVITNAGGVIIPNMQAIFRCTPNSGSGIYNRVNGGTNDGKMFADVADIYNQATFANYGYLDLTNIPYANYNIYCYFRPDNGSGSANTRGGFLLITNAPTGTNRLYLKNQSNDVSFTQLAVPGTGGSGYVQAFTTIIGNGGAAVPWSSIDSGNFAVFYGLTNSWTRVFFGGLGNSSMNNTNGASDDIGNYVLGGSTAVRFKLAGFQIVQTPSPNGTVTNLHLLSPIPNLLPGNPTPYAPQVFGDFQGGYSLNLYGLPGLSFVSQNTSVATVDNFGRIFPQAPGTANIVTTFTNNTSSASMTNQVTVLTPTQLILSVNSPTNLFIGKNGAADQTSLQLLGVFSGPQTNNVTTFGQTSFGGSANVSVSSAGAIAALGPAGTYGISATYAGVSTNLNPAGSIVQFVSPPAFPALSVHVTDALPPSSHAMNFKYLSGAPGVRVGYWNNMIFNGNTASNQIVNPLDSLGNILTNVVVQMTGRAAGGGIAVAAGTITTNESVLFHTYYDSGLTLSAGSNSTIDLGVINISNVPYASYDVYFYLENDNASTNRPGHFVIDGVDKYRRNFNAGMGAQDYGNGVGNPAETNGVAYGYVEAVNITSTPVFCSQIAGGNYVKFANITDPNLHVDWGAVYQDIVVDCDSVTRMRLTGFQIVNSISGLTATNLYLQTPLPGLLPGSGSTFPLVVLADFTTGLKGGNVTALPGTSFSSDNTGIFTVDANGVITPTSTPGTAHLIVHYTNATSNLSLTQAVTVLAPVAVNVTSIPDVLYIDSVLGPQTAQAQVIASFVGYTNVNVSSYATIGYVDQGSPVVTMNNTTGVITPNTKGTASLGATYLGNTYVTANAITVRSINDPASLVHRYPFRDAPGSSMVSDIVDGANGAIIPPILGALPIVLDGERANFPGGSYSNAAYINLPPGLIGSMSDVTIQVWGGINTNAPWQRFFGAGSTPKGTDPHNLGGTATSALELIADYGQADVDMEARFTAGFNEIRTGTNLVFGTQYQLVFVYAPNKGIGKAYINGVPNGSFTPTNGATLSTLNDQVDWVGISLNNNDSPLNGWVDDLSIYEGAFSDADVASSFAAGAYQGLVPATSLAPVKLSANVSSGALHLTWPADHQGWILQTNASGLASPNSWFPYPGSGSGTTQTFPIDSTKTNVFFRLVAP